MNLTKQQKLFGIVGLLTFLFLMVFFNIPEKIVEIIGIQNAYIAVFLIAAFGGVSSLTATSYFSTVILFAKAGLNPLYLGILGGVGVTIGDSLFFLFGQHGRIVLSERIEWTMNMLKKRLDRFHKWSMPLFVYLYSGFTPFPNEFMTVSVGLTGAKYREIIVPLLLGNITITTLLVLSVQYAAGL